MLSYDVLLGPDLCEEVSCEPGFVCKNGECVADPCAQELSVSLGKSALMELLSNP
jgi:hypothetical protein